MHPSSQDNEVRSTIENTTSDFRVVVFPGGAGVLVQKRLERADRSGDRRDVGGSAGETDALEREERTKVISAEGSRGVEAASISAWRLDPARPISREVTKQRSERSSGWKVDVDDGHTGSDGVGEER